MQDNTELDGRAGRAALGGAEGAIEEKAEEEGEEEEGEEGEDWGGKKDQTYKIREPLTEVRE